MDKEKYEPTPNDLQILRDWIKQMPHIPQDYDDRFLSAFYRASKGMMQKTKLSLESFCNAGERCPEMFSDLDPKRRFLQEYLGQIYSFEIPMATSKDETIVGFTFRPENLDVSKCHTLEIIRLFVISILINIKEKNYWSAKVVFIVDCNGIQLEMAKDYTPARLAFLVDCLKRGLLLRVQAIHCVNVPIFLEWMVDLMKKLAPKKIGDRIILHRKDETLPNYISKNLLPKEYGGTCSTLVELNEQFVARLMSNRDYLINEDQRNRKLDHLRPKPAEDDFNITDTFRKLDVD